MEGPRFLSPIEQNIVLNHSLQTYKGSVFVTDTMPVIKDGHKYLLSDYQKDFTGHLNSFARWVTTSSKTNQLAIKEFIEEHQNILKHHLNGDFCEIPDDALRLLRNNETLLKEIITITQDKFFKGICEVPSFVSYFDQKVIDALQSVVHDRTLDPVIEDLKRGFSRSEDEQAMNRLKQVFHKVIDFASPETKKLLCYRRVKVLEEAYQITRKVDAILSKDFSPSNPRLVQFIETINDIIKNASSNRAHYLGNRRVVRLRELASQILNISSLKRLFPCLERKMDLVFQATGVNLDSLPCDLYKQITNVAGANYPLIRGYPRWNAHLFNFEVESFKTFYEDFKAMLNVSYTVTNGFGLTCNATVINVDLSYFIGSLNPKKSIDDFRSFHRFKLAGAHKIEHFRNFLETFYQRYPRNQISILIYSLSDMEKYFNRVSTFTCSALFLVAEGLIEQNKVRLEAQINDVRTNIVPRF